MVVEVVGVAFHWLTLERIMLDRLCLAPTLTGFVRMVEPKLRSFLHASVLSGLSTVSAIRPASSVLHACLALRGILLNNRWLSDARVVALSCLPMAASDWQVVNPKELGRQLYVESGLLQWLPEVC